MEGRFGRALASKRRLVSSAGTVLLTAMAVASLASAGVEAPTPAVGSFFARQVYTSHAGKITILGFEVPGTGPTENVTAACSACGGAGFTRNKNPGEAILDVSPPVRVSATTRVLIGAYFSGLTGRWKLYGLFHGAWSRLAEGCMPASVRGLTSAEAVDPWTIPPATTCPPWGPPPRAEYVLWRGTDSKLWELEYTFGAWDPSPPVYRGRLGSTPSVAVHPDGQQDVFWTAPGGQLEEMRYLGAWIGPTPIGNADTLGSAPSAVVDPTDPDER